MTDNEEPTAPASAGKAFIITQIGSPDSPARAWASGVEEHVLAPALSSFGLDIYRSDRDPLPGPISMQMIKELHGAAVIIADLTGRNPNVFYELGIAHALTRPVIVLVDAVSSLPFDVSEERAIMLPSIAGVLTASGAKSALSDLKKSLALVMEPGYEPRNFVFQAGLSNSFDRAAGGTGDRTEDEFAVLRSEMSSMGRSIMARMDIMQEYMTAYGDRDAYRTSAAENLLKGQVSNLAERDEARRRAILARISNTSEKRLGEVLEEWTRATGSPDWPPTNSDDKNA